jgi:streptogramin lyase
MSDLGPVLERVRDRFVLPPGAFDRLVARRARKRRNQRAWAGVVALILFGGILAGLWTVARLTPKPAASSPGVLPGEALDVAVGDGSVWAITCDRRCDDDGRQSEGSLVRVDPTTSRVVASATVARPHALAVGEGGVWVVDFWEGTVTRFDPETLRPVATIKLALPDEVPGDHSFLPLHLATGEGAVWVSTARGAVARIDPATNAVSKVIELSPALTGDVAAGEGSVWVGEVPGVKQIDPKTGGVIASLGLGVQPGTVLVADGSVWVDGVQVRWAGAAKGYAPAGGPVLLRLEPSTGRVQTRIPLPPAARVVVGEGIAWASDAQDTLEAFDSVGRVIGEPLPGGGGFLAADGKAVWVVNGQRLWRAVLCSAGPCIEPPGQMGSPPPSATSCDQLIPDCHAERLPDLVLSDGTPAPDGTQALGSVTGPTDGVIGFDQALIRAWEEDGHGDATTVQVVLGSADPEAMHWETSNRLFYGVAWGGTTQCGHGGMALSSPRTPTPNCFIVTAGTIVDALTGAFIVGGS